MLKRLRGWYLACLVAALALYAGGLALNVSTDEATFGSGFVNWVKGLPSIGTGGGGNGSGPGNNGSTGNKGGTGNNGTTGNNGGTGTTGGGGPTGKRATTPSTAPEDLMDADHGFRYGLLDESLRDSYDVVLEGLHAREERFDIDGLTAGNLDAVYQAVVFDHPELFWQLTTYQYYDNGDSVELLPNYALSKDKAKSLEQQIEDAAADALSGIASDASDYDKVKYCYEWVVNNTDYVHSAHDQTIQGVLLDHQAVCAGYSQTMLYLLAKLGVRCCYISGKAVDGDLHAWNMVWIDGTPAYVDVTWGDPVSTSDDGSIAPGNKLIYDYLCLTTKEMDREHIAWAPEKPQLPVCKATKLSYYRQCGLYMKTFDRDALASFIQEACDRGETSVRFKLASRKEQKAALAFVQTSDIYGCFPLPVSNVSLSHGEKIYTVEVAWEY